MHRSGRAGSTWAARLSTSVVLAFAITLPGQVRADLVAEAAFLADTLPPGSRDLNVSVGLTRAEAEDGGAQLSTAPRVQVTMPVNERFGLTADVGLLVTSGPAAATEVDTPALSLKYEISPAGDGATGLSASADVFASTHAFRDTEAGLNFGAIRDLGGVTMRAALGGVTPLGTWSPRLQAGASLAIEPARNWRLFGEAVGSWSVNAGERTLALGPGVKYAPSARTALMAAGIVGVAGNAGEVAGVVQLTLGL